MIHRTDRKPGPGNTSIMLRDAHIKNSDRNLFINRKHGGGGGGGARGRGEGSGGGGGVEVGLGGEGELRCLRRGEELGEG